MWAVCAVLCVSALAGASRAMFFQGLRAAKEARGCTPLEDPRALVRNILGEALNPRLPSTLELTLSPNAA